MAIVEQIRDCGTKKYWEGLNPQTAAIEAVEKLWKGEPVLNKRVPLNNLLKGNLKKMGSIMRNLDDKIDFYTFVEKVKGKNLKYSNELYEHQVLKGETYSFQQKDFILLEGWKEELKKDDLIYKLEKTIQDYIDIRLSKKPINVIKIEIEDSLIIEVEVYHDKTVKDINLLDKEFEDLKNEIWFILSNGTCGISYQILELKKIFEERGTKAPL